MYQIKIKLYSIALTIGACCLIFNGQTAAQELPLTDFVRHSDYLDIKISPDGEHLAARIRHKESVYMIVRRVSDGEIVGGLKPGDKNEIASVHWANNKRLIYTFAEKYYYNDSAFQTGELFAVNLDGKADKMLAGYRASDAQAGRRFKSKGDDYSTHRLLNVLPDDEKNVLIVEYPWSRTGSTTYPTVSKLNIYNGIKTQKERIPYPRARVFANDEGEVNFVTWSDDAISLNAAYRTSKTDEWENITSSLKNDSGSLTPVRINKNGTVIYFTDEVGDDGIESVFALELSTKRISKVFDNNAELEFWKTDINGDPVIATSYPGRHKYHYSLLKPNSNLIKHHKKLKNSFANQEVQISSYSEDGKLMVLSVGSDINPGEYYLYNAESKKAEFLWANYSWIDPRTLAAMEPIKLAARDGQELNGYLTVPKAELNRQALVVLPHGGPHGVRDFPHYSPEVQFLANRGYTVLQINFRGSSGYGVAFEKQGYKNWGNVMVDDVIDATKWAIKEGHADKDKVCIYGASYGGYSALMSAVKAPDLYKCTIGYVGVYDLEIMKVKGDIPRGFRGRRYLDRVLGSDIESLKAQSPLNHAHKIKAKVMLIHGDEDRRVPSVHAKKMRAALRKAKNPAEWLYLGDAGHGAFSEKNRTKVYERLLSFLNENIGGEN